MPKPPSHRRSCTACVLAKRRCDLKPSQCSRCMSKGVDCTYDNEPSFSSKPAEAGSSAEPQPRPTQEVGVFTPSNVGLPDMDSMSLFNPDMLNPSSPFIPSFNLIPSSIVLPAVNATGRQNGDTLAYLNSQVRSYPASFVYQAKTPFIHPRSCQNQTPQALQDAFTVCAVYLTMTPSNKSTVFRIIESKAADLIQNHTGTEISIPEDLACVQALILVQIVQLFDGDIRQRAIAERNESVLIQWTEQLQSRTGAHLQTSTAQDWSSWIFAESVRRTVIMSHLPRFLYYTLRQGFCIGSSKMAPMVFTPSAAMWDMSFSNSLQDVSSSTLPPVSSYYDFIIKWERGYREQIEPFERTLLIACKGEECAEVMYSDPQYVNRITN